MLTLSLCQIARLDLWNYQKPNQATLSDTGNLEQCGLWFVGSLSKGVTVSKSKNLARLLLWFVVKLVIACNNPVLDGAAWHCSINQVCWTTILLLYQQATFLILFKKIWIFMKNVTKPYFLFVIMLFKKCSMQFL